MGRKEVEQVGIWEAVIYWVILVISALCVIAVSGNRKTASTIILVPVVLFCTIFMMQGSMFTAMNHPTMGGNVGLGMAFLTTWVVSGILFVVALVIAFIRYSKRNKA
ncbi:hypothetical protein ACFQ5D_05000 [Paenibacillus farraposensis]|uniref:Uncharacterized protein n=1 Tax=Paenibacillus farraposensis TaxID=2807095 RepID=A0ABW4D9Q7_9BACL|nr:hypothetical protein [Paenibacillus farraposensis]MCC3379020.1 hypothetical protein [Paenibacillus farraposensis]